MPRTDIHLDAMLRHLGAAYYESLHGRATRADVARALDTVEEHLREHAGKPGPAAPAAAQPAPRERGGREPGEARQPRPDGARTPHRRWARRVRDVMTTTVVSVDRITPYKEIARLLTDHRISGVPVLTMGRHVAGVVTEADLLAAEDKPARAARAASASGRRLWVRARRHPAAALVAGDLMTSPAITIHPDATIPAAARVMNANHVRRLPVVDPDGKLIGIVSRRDLLSVFLRPDSEIAEDARAVLDDILLAEPGDATVTVRNGVVVLSGTLKPAEDHRTSLVPVAIRLLWDIDGVVDVINHLGEAQPEAARQSA
ncbi:MAG TPA: CBS domain-containing protein [Trebonia sp.]|jgi:CBS-domain-containing membrane protein|nr:CBS domain-containing protein [Trebonia sp.]